MGHQAVECHPGAAQDLWGIPQQHKDRLGLLNGLRKLGLRGLKKHRPATSWTLQQRHSSDDGSSSVRG